MLPGKTWAQLVRGTPLVTAARDGKGMIVLFHVTADTTWSNSAALRSLRRHAAQDRRSVGHGPAKRRRCAASGEAQKSAVVRRPAFSMVSACSARRRDRKPDSRQFRRARPTPNIRRAFTVRPITTRRQCAWRQRQSVDAADFSGLGSRGRLCAGRCRSICGRPARSGLSSLHRRRLGFALALRRLRAPLSAGRLRRLAIAALSALPRSFSATVHVPAASRSDAPLSATRSSIGAQYAARLRHQRRSGGRRGEQERPDRRCRRCWHSARHSFPARRSASIPRATNSLSIRCSIGRSSPDGRSPRRRRSPRSPLNEAGRHDHLRYARRLDRAGRRAADAGGAVAAPTPSPASTCRRLEPVPRRSCRDQDLLSLDGFVGRYDERPDLDRSLAAAQSRRRGAAGARRRWRFADHHHLERSRRRLGGGRRTATVSMR